MLQENQQRNLELTIQPGTANQEWHKDRARYVLWYFAVPVLAVAVIFLVLLTVRVSGTLLPYTDVFVPYHAIARGQSTTVLEGYSCQKPYIADRGIANVLCTLLSDSGPFRMVTVIAHSHEVRGITFSPRNMRLVDLVWYWGRPDRVYKVGGRFEAQLTRRAQAVAELGRRYSLQAPVSRILLTDY